MMNNAAPVEEIECENCYYKLTGKLLVGPVWTKLIDSNPNVKESL